MTVKELIEALVPFKDDAQVTVTVEMSDGTKRRCDLGGSFIIRPDNSPDRTDVEFLVRVKLFYDFSLNIEEATND